MTEKTDKILNQIKKELEGIKNELKKSNASRDKRYKEWTKMKKINKNTEYFITISILPFPQRLRGLFLG